MPSLPGPFVPSILPVHSSIKWSDKTGLWSVFVSRRVTAGAGSRREESRQKFTTYFQALTYVSVFWGNG